MRRSPQRDSAIDLRSDDMGAAVVKEVIRRTPGVEKAEVDDVVMGCSWPAFDSSTWIR